jgi:putative endonuclease
MIVDEAVADVEGRPAAYVLRGASGDYLYKGSCRDLVERLKNHRAGRVAHTKNRRPLNLVYHEYFASYTEARKRELFFKTGAGREFVAARVAERQTQQT